MIYDVEVFFKHNTRLANKIVDFKRIDIYQKTFEVSQKTVQGTLKN